MVLKSKVLAMVILSTLLMSGCSTMQKAKRTDELEAQVVQLNQEIKDRDSQIAQLQQMLDQQQSDSQKNFERLKDQLEELKAKQEASKSGKNLK